VEAHANEVAKMDVRTCTRTLDIIEIFATLKRPLTLTEIAGRLEIPVSSCYGIVRTLQSRGYLFSHRQRGPLYPTKRFLEIAQAIAAADPLATRAAPVLSQLRDDTGETVVVGNLRGDTAFYLDVYVPDRPIRYVPRIGEARELHATAMGKTLLGALPPAQRSEVIRRLSFHPHTSTTITTPAALEENIRLGLARGWHGSLKERFDELSAVGMPIHLKGQVYGVTLTGPASRFEGDLLTRLADMLKAACASIDD
jgi:DNA-binding IclR family transcriptional regulator